jgi:hypothetical protein
MYEERRKGDGGKVVLRERSEWYVGTSRQVVYFRPHFSGGATESITVSVSFRHACVGRLDDPLVPGSRARGGREVAWFHHDDRAAG